MVNDKAWGLRICSEKQSEACSMTPSIDECCRQSCQTTCTFRSRSDSSLPLVQDSASDISERDTSPRELNEVDIAEPAKQVQEGSSSTCSSSSQVPPHLAGLLVQEPDLQGGRAGLSRTRPVSLGSVKDMPYTLVNGVRYPPFFKEAAVVQMHKQFEPRAGDVFLACNFPVFGLQATLVALVEGRDDPWAFDVIDKAHMLDAGASRRGVQPWIDLAESWATPSGRRLFKTPAFPDLFPSRYPFDAEPSEGKPAPKIVVLTADPRNYLTMLWGSTKLCFGRDLPYTELLEEFLESEGESMFLGSWIKYTAAWSKEAERNPDQVRLFSMDRLGSLDPKEFATELMAIADFIGVDKGAAEQMTKRVFRRPMLVQPPPSEMDPQRRWLYQAFESGHLIEQSARNRYMFEETLSQLSATSVALWAHMLSTVRQYPGSTCLLELAQAASKGVLSLPPVGLTQVSKGDMTHNAGLCKPCVFALRGVCKDGAELCRFCHDPSHPRTKRATRSKRAAKKAVIRIRTPSPDSSPYQMVVVTQLPVVVLEAATSAWGGNWRYE
jgi:hypothetical protein